MLKDNKHIQIFLISKNLVVDQKKLGKVIVLGVEGWIVYFWDKRLFERHMANVRGQDLHHEKV